MSRLFFKVNIGFLSIHSHRNESRYSQSTKRNPVKRQKTQHNSTYSPPRLMAIAFWLIIKTANAGVFPKILRDDFRRLTNQQRSNFGWCNS